ncbi:NACHT domain-containing protein [Erwinia sp. AnSW2-5]|uniref:NACHT domain-containing protein n=1 Tax=Erwinia sp. AnSW2-5 TaxID=3367692 RepID=UPI00385CC27B
MSGSQAKKKKGSGAAGGSGNDIGSGYAASLAAWAAVNMLGKYADLPWGLSQDCCITCITCQSSLAEIDDIVLQLSTGGRVCFQAKHALKKGKEFEKAVAQLVGEFHSSSFNHGEDRLIIATDHYASAIIRDHLTRILNRCKMPDFTPAKLHDVVSEFVSEDEINVWQYFRDNVENAWRLSGHPLNEQQFCHFLMHTRIFVIDPRINDVDKTDCIKRLRSDLQTKNPAGVWTVLIQLCAKAAAERLSYTREELFHELAQQKMIVTYAPTPHAAIREGAEYLNQSQLQYALHHADAIYLPRTTMDAEVVTFIAGESQVLIFSGESGKGKTSWCTDTCRVLQKQGYVLIHGDYLSEHDTSLFASLNRLIMQHMREAALSLTAGDIHDWLLQQSLVVVIDGLDRIPVAMIPRLRTWFERTLNEIVTTKNKLILTTRPESLSSLSRFFKNETLYKKENQSFVTVDDFTEAEAVKVALMLGNPRLACYRHPGMMMFCHNLNLTDNDNALSQTEIISRYTDHLIDDIAGHGGLLKSRVAFFVEEVVGVALESASAAVLEKTQYNHLMNQDRECFEAAMRCNVLTEKNGTVRVEPDSVSEYLQGQHIDIGEQLRRLDQICEVPLKLGALRSRLEQDAQTQQDVVIDWMQQIIEHWKNRQNSELLAMLCHVIAELPHLHAAEKLIKEMAQESDQSNSVLEVAGFDLLKLLADKRWSHSQRREMLWLLAKNESGYDWRTKHWLTPVYAPNFISTPWKWVILREIEEDKKDGFDFLISHFSNEEIFSDTCEAVIGHLAQGLFYLSAASDIRLALQRLEHHGEYDMVGNLTQGMQDQIVAELPELMSDSVLQVNAISVILTALVQHHCTNIPLPLITVLRSMEDNDRYVEIKLKVRRVLALSGDYNTCQLLMQGALHYAEVSIIDVFSGREFTQLVDIAFQKIASGDSDRLAVYAFCGFQLDREKFIILTNCIAKYHAENVGFITLLADVIENMIYRSYKIEDIPDDFIVFILALFEYENILKNIIYASSGHDKDDALTPQGSAFRRKLLVALSQYITSDKHVSLLTSNLTSRHDDMAFVTSLLVNIQQRLPDVDVASYISWSFRAEEEIQSVHASVSACYRHG